MSECPIPVVVIFAPTASGKTALTRELFCEKGSHFILNAEIISADSQAVYKGMDIGTAKPEPSFCAQIPHHLIDVVTPDVQFSVADFIEMADKACRNIYGRGRLPVVCGGTGFYIRNFLFGLPKTPKSNDIIREQLKTRIAAEGNEALYAQLMTVDPESAAKIHVNDAYRICRALEVFYTTGKKRSDCAVEAKLRSDYDFCFIVLEPVREELYGRIRERVDLMFERGLLNEVAGLIEAGYTRESPGMKAIGYSEFFEEIGRGALDLNSLKSACTVKGTGIGEGGCAAPTSALEKIREAIKHHSCKYAKKQYTYIRDIPESQIIYYNNSEMDLQKIAALVRKFVKEHGFLLT